MAHAAGANRRNTASTFVAQDRIMSAARKLSGLDAHIQGARPRQGPRSPGADATAAVSPARELQASLLAELAADRSSADEPRRWPGVVRLAVIGGSSCAFWGALIAGGVRLFSHA